MPLIHSPTREAASKNIAEFHTGPTYAHTAAKFGKKKADAQAIAVALSNARKSGAKFKVGGTPKKSAVHIAKEIQRRAKQEHMAAGGTPTTVRSEMRGMEHAGMIHSAVPGRTDRIPMGVRSNSYVLPADVVSGLGQGNSMAGSHALNRLFSSGPYGSAKSSISVPGVHKTANILRQRFASGGDSKPTEIVAAGGEYVVDPDTVARIGGGDHKRGHAILDAFVKHIRSKTVKTLRKLPGPKRS